MAETTFLQIFLLVDIFIIGALSATAIQHAYAHFRPKKQEADKVQYTPSIEQHLPDDVRDRVLKASEHQFQAVLNNSANLLQHDLQDTAGQINNLVNRLATEIVSGELERYSKELSQLHNQAAVDIGGIKKELSGHEAGLKDKLAKEMEAEKQQMLKQIDTKLADAVGSFLVEALQHNIDLGSQAPYLIGLLEEHKADFAKEVADGN